MQKLLAALDNLSTARVLVIGDLILDHYIYGDTDRTSPEAPVPVVLVARHSYAAGGAANVARNLVAAGANTFCIGLAGTDPAADNLVEAMAGGNVDGKYITRSQRRRTVQKTRVVSQGQQIVRLDTEDSITADEWETKALSESIRQCMPGCTAIILSDYAKGVLSDDLIAEVIAAASAQGIPVFVDPKGREYARYRGCTVLTPNAREAREATNHSVNTHADLETVAMAIRHTADCESVIITRGADGLAVLSPDEAMLYIPATAREVFDVTGAGDTFVAWLAALAGSGAPLHTAAQLANVAAGVAVGRAGAVAVSYHEVRQALMPGRLGRKLISEGGLKAFAHELRSQGKRIVLANGCFDFLHAGHVDFFERARKLGDVLVVATNTDDMITRLKGPGRPVIPAPQRQVLLASVESVDFVVMFGEPTPHRIIGELKPDVIVKGDNYSADQVEGADQVSQYGGEVVLVPVTYRVSTGDFLAN